MARSTGPAHVMLTIDDLRSSAVALDWHEAVAVAAALAGLAAAAPPTSGCPAPGNVMLLPSGELRVAGSDVVGTSPVQGLAIVLGRLLETAPCPAELRQLVETYEDEEFAARAGDGSVARFAASLAFFERPGRAEVLAAVASRAEPALERARGAAALEELTERTRQAAAAGKASKASTALPATETSQPWAAAVPRGPSEQAAGPSPADPSGEGAFNRYLIPAIGVVVFLTMAYAAASYFTPTPPAAGHASDAAPPDEDLPVSGPGLGQPAKPVSRVAATRKPVPTAATPTVSASPPPHASTQAETASVPPSAPPARAASEPTPGSSVPPAARSGIDVAVAERDGGVLPTPTPATRPGARVPTGRVFTIGDPKVTPAVLVRPHLPEQPPPDVPEEQIGTLEFVVAESGAVEHVHLVSPANRYQERMIVAAAKTWTFQPATRDGHPVRFRTRIRVTL